MCYALLLSFLPILQEIGLGVISSWLYDFINKKKNNEVEANINKNAVILSSTKVEFTHCIVVVTTKGNEETIEGEKEKIPSFSKDISKLVTLDSLAYLYPEVIEKLERDAQYGFQYYLSLKKFKDINSPYTSDLENAIQFFQTKPGYTSLSSWIDIFTKLDRDALIEPLVIWVAQNIGKQITKEQFTSYVKALGEEGLRLGDYKLDGKTISIIFVGRHAKPPEMYLPRCAGLIKENKIVFICSRGEFYSEKAKKITSLLLELFSGIELRTRQVRYAVRTPYNCAEFTVIYVAKPEGT